jgi:hypothetical protein
MPTYKIPHNLLVVATTVSHAVMVAGAIALYFAGKIDSTAFLAIMTGFGGAYSGAAGALIAVKGSKAVTSPAGGTTPPSATAAPASTSSATPAETTT